MDHDVIEERIIAYVLGGLDPIERAALEAELADHLPSCDTCPELLSDFTAVAERLALATPPVAPPPHLEDRIVALATGRQGGERTRKGSRPMRRVALAAAAAVVLVAGSVAGTLLATGDQGGPERVVRLQGLSSGQLAVAYRSGTDQALVVGHDLPTPPNGRVYQLWLLGGDEPVSAGTYLPEGGEILTATSLPTKDFDGVALTIEPSGGSTGPTTDPIAKATVPRAS